MLSTKPGTVSGRCDPRGLTELGDTLPRPPGPQTHARQVAVQLLAGTPAPGGLALPASLTCSLPLPPQSCTPESPQVLGISCP